jgi:hypothetical protein
MPVLCSHSHGFPCIICSPLIVRCVVCMQTVHRAMLPVLLKLLHMPTVLDTAPQVLTDLLQQSPAMQKAANDSDAVSSLTTLLHHEQTWHNRPCFKASLSLCCQPQQQHLNCSYCCAGKVCHNHHHQAQLQQQKLALQRRSASHFP